MTIEGEEGLSFLSRASAILGSSLDYEVTLRSVAQLVVPWLGDWCLMHLREADNGPVACVAHAHVDATKEGHLAELVAAKMFDGSLLGAESVLASGASEYHDHLPLFLRTLLPDQTHARIDALGAESAMHVPLKVGGRTLGVLTIVSASSERAYGDRHLLVAEELGLRAAVAVDHARTHNEAKVAAAQFQTILSAVSDGITTQDVSGRLLFANDAAAHLCWMPDAASLLASGTRRIALAQVDVYDEDHNAIPPDDLPGRRALLTGERAESIVGSRHRPSGEERWSAVRATPLRDEAGHVQMVVNVIHDYTDKKNAISAQRFLAEASAALGGSLEADTIATRLLELLVPRLGHVAVMYLADADKEPLCTGVDSAVAARARASFGVKEALEGGPARFWSAPIERIIGELGVTAHGIVPLQGRGGVEGALVIGFAGRHRVYSAETAALVEDVVRRAVGAIENARLYREAREAVKARDVFLSVASHELKTPLTSLRLQTQSMARDLRRAEDSALVRTISPKVDAVEQQLRRLTELVNGLLDVSRITGQKLQLFPERTDLTALTEEVAHRFHPVLAKTGCEMRLDLAGEVFGTWDRLRLDQVITNLLSNAVKYGAARPIEIVLREDGRRARLTVRDEGIGIASEDQNRIFERFERAVAETHVPGFGMGLWIAREIVEAHAGHIVVESAPGRGSRFTVELPTDPKA
jgi:signal transduction histidine kinase/PAS domain-containing protein